MPTEPRTVDVLRNISPGQVVQIAWSQHFLPAENSAFTYRPITRFVLCQNLAESGNDVDASLPSLGLGCTNLIVPDFPRTLIVSPS